jgi:hypothetical protein
MAINQLEAGFPGKRTERAGIQMEPLPLGHELTETQAWALETTISQVTGLTIRNAIAGDFTPQNVRGVISQLSNPRFRFLDQIPEARDVLLAAINDPRIPEQVRIQWSEALEEAMNIPH